MAGILNYLRRKRRKPTPLSPNLSQETTQRLNESSATLYPTYSEVPVDSTTILNESRKQLTPRPMTPERKLALQFKAHTFTLLGHHWNQAATNWRKAQVIGLGLATQSQVDLTNEEQVDIVDQQEEEGESVSQNYFDHDGRFTKEYGFASPYTQHGGTVTETHHHYPPPAVQEPQRPQQPPAANPWPWLLLAVPSTAGVLAFAAWLWTREPIDHTNDVDVTAKTSYIPPRQTP